ncbi:MAG: hypothetical protein QOF33_1606, partial [Thermomicrobiales bacterium]|nr:hypothetical protein [Thermomicrobiales bacterium]
VLEIHPWGAGIADVDKPDRITMDLDPAEDVAWEQVIAAALDVRETRERAIAATLQAHLSGQELLLILDNVEHVVEGAPLFAELLTACPALTILATSRSVLHLSGERDVSVPPLPLPPLPNSRAEPAAEVRPALVAELATTAAVSLFVERAQAARADFALTEENAPAVAAICHRLEGLPLAIELAAARVAILPPAAVLARLEPRLPLLTGGPRDQPARHRTMHNAIAWSHDLLDEAEQTLFRRLSVFAGGFTLEAAEYVVGESARRSSPTSVIDEISSLVHNSLLYPVVTPNGNASLVHNSPLHPVVAHYGEPRFAMLETVREFALERMATAGEEAISRDRHAAWCRSQLWELWPMMLAPAVPKEPLARLAGERDNWRTALSWLDTNGQFAALLELTGLLFWYWLWFSQVGDGLRWLNRALAVGPFAPTAARVWVMLATGLLAQRDTDEDRAGVLLNECLAMARALGDPEVLRLALLLVGAATEDMGDYARAEWLLTEGLALNRAAAATWETGHNLYHLGVVAWGKGEGRRAIALLEESLALHQADGDVWAATDAQVYLGLIVTDLGDCARAASLLRETLAVRAELGVTFEISTCLVTVAVLGVATRQEGKAARLFGAGFALREDLGSSFQPPERETYHRCIIMARSVLGEAAFSTAWEEGRRLSQDQAIAEASAVLAEIEETPLTPSRGTVAGELTARETEILRLLVRRLTNKEIADVLSISPRTVMNHVASILGTLGGALRREAADWAIRHDPE